MDIPEEFWKEVDVRHISSFKNRAEYNIYLAKEFEKWKLNK